jgi:hypothetical protein
MHKAEQSPSLLFGKKALAGPYQTTGPRFLRRGRDQQLTPILPGAFASARFSGVVNAWQSKTEPKRLSIRG